MHQKRKKVRLVRLKHTKKVRLVRQKHTNKVCLYSASKAHKERASSASKVHKESASRASSASIPPKSASSASKREANATTKHKALLCIMLYLHIFCIMSHYKTSINIKALYGILVSNSHFLTSLSHEDRKPWIYQKYNMDITHHDTIIEANLNESNVTFKQILDFYELSSQNIILNFLFVILMHVKLKKTMNIYLHSQPTYHKWKKKRSGYKFLHKNKVANSYKIRADNFYFSYGKYLCNSISNPSS